MSNQQPVIDFLKNPGNYPDASAVEVIETHGAMVFLAGDYAYKLKKNVSFPYMDYGTLARRQEMCGAEIALNQRTAPEIYLRTQALYLNNNGQVAWDQTDTVADWLVVMRRFDGSQVLDAVASQATLPDSLWQGLADQVATFHQAAAISHTYGGADSLADTVRGNDQMFASYTDVLPRDISKTLSEHSLHCISTLKELLDNRQANGKMRRCHGDLHLRNICLIEGAPVLFDCIEFNDAFATIDVLYDLAFLLMDMEYRGLKAPANLVLNRYLQQTMDYDGLRALPVMLATRAAIRSHVSVAIAKGTGLNSFLEDAARYLDTALGYLQTTHVKLTAVGGLSGSGKSTYAQQLASQTSAIVLRTDVIRKHLAGAGLTEKLPQDWYTPEKSAIVYAEVHRIAASLINAGFSVITDGVYANQEERSAVEAIATTAKARFEGIWMEIPDALAEARLAKRQHDASDADMRIRKMQQTDIKGDIAWKRTG